MELENEYQPKPMTNSIKPNDEIRVALEYARDRHQGQVRSRGSDIGLSYFDTHIIRVVSAVPEWARPAAALHDVLEDTTATLPLLRSYGFSPNTLAAVDLLTRRPTDTYQQFIDRIAGDTTSANDTMYAGPEYQIARAVKLADLIDNMHGLTNGGLRLRYIKALGQVASAIIHFRDPT